MDTLISKQRFKHHTGFQIATYFDVETGSEIFGPRQFLEFLSESTGSPQNSIDAAIDDLFMFIKFLHVCAKLQVERGQWIGDTGKYLTRVLLKYPGFLAEAQRSPSEFVATVAAELGFKGYAESTVRRHLATVNQFMNFNNQEWISQQALSKYSEIDIFVSETDLVGQLAKRSAAKKYEVAGMLSRSMIAGIISGGPKKISRPALEMPRRFRNNQEAKKKVYKKSFPIDRVLDLIENATSYRDICFFSLLAGTGIRTHEALQMLLKDIDVENQTVLMPAFNTRIEVYDDLTGEQFTELSSKGRTSEDVEFIKPFRGIFFENLLNYLDEERDDCAPKHDFLFITLANNSKGKAWFLSDATSHNRTFKAVQQKIGVSPTHSLHSLRHFYGTWLRNYAPHKNGFGYPISVVRRAMGHKFEATTEGYSIPDKKIVLRQMKEVNAVFERFGFDFGKVKRLVEKGE